MEAGSFGNVPICELRSYIERDIDDSSLRAHPIITIVIETANRHRFGFAEITCAGPRGVPRGTAVIPHPRSITVIVRIDFPVMCALPTSLRLSFVQTVKL